MLSADIGVIERPGFLPRKCERLLHARRIGNVADHFLVGAGTDFLFDGDADGVEDVRIFECLVNVVAGGAEFAHQER